MTIIALILTTLLSGSINFKTLPIEESGTNINAICQDSLGRIWFGGSEGIVRYDGNRYEHFSSSIKDDSQVPDNSVYDIICDTEGTIWIAHISGLSRYDSRRNSFIYYPTTSDPISRVVELPSGDLLLLIGDRLWYFRTAEEKFTRDGIPDILFIQSATAIRMDSSNIYIGTKNGRLFMCSRDMQNVSEINTDLLKKRILCILEDDKSDLWIGTESDGLWKVSVKGNSCVRYKDSSNIGRTDVIKAMHIDDAGTLWIGTKKGLKVLQNGKITTYVHDGKPGSIPHDSVGAILSDWQGTIWLGTYYGGVCYHSPHSSSFRHVPLNPTSGVIYGNIISDIVEDKDGSMWIGTNSGGLIRLSPDGTLKNIKIGTEEDSQIDVKCIHISPISGNIYVGADRSELFVMNRNTNKLNPIGTESPKSCYAMEYNQKDGFYIGTFDGLYEYDEKKDRFSRIYFTGDNTNIKSLKLDSQGVLWIGKKNGITAIHKDDARLLELPESISSVKYAEIIMEDSKGKIWIGSRGGLYCYNPKDGGCQTYTEREGLPHHTIHGIEEDKDGILWISTDKGLCRFDQETGERITCTTSDGLLDNRFTTYAHCMTRDGKLCFGSINGLVIFDPASISFERKTPPPVICGIEINGAWNGIPEKKVVLEPRERSITFMFSSPDYVSEKNGRFYYRLEGLETEWKMAGMDWKAAYQNLPAGDYVFKVRYMDSSGKGCPETESIHLRIREFWYKTTVAVIIYTVVILFLALFLLNYLVSEKEKKYKDKMDQFRNKILHDFSLEFRSQNSPDAKSEVRRNFDESDEKFMRHAMKVVRENMDNAAFSVDDFAGKMFMSRSNLNLKVKALFGVSPLELIKTVRFNEACRLLQEKKHSMTEISEMVGFTTSSYFTSAFKKFMGCTPSEYIKKNN